MSSSELQLNRDALKTLLLKANVKPNRENGQNFLIDADTVDALVDAAQVAPNDTVLEIGPGLGAVTGTLLEKGAHVIAVELDRMLSASLTKRFHSEPLLKLVNANVLHVPLEDYVKDGSYKLVSSLPFNITSIVLRRFLEQAPRPSVISLVIQREVAERVTAPPGTMSMLSVAVQYLGEPSIVHEVPRTSFWPVPEVDAAVIRIGVRPIPPKDEMAQVFKTAKIGFSARRKMLHHNLSAGFHVPTQEVKERLIGIGLNPLCRAQELTVEQWRRLAQYWF